jgi:hypothetical protein
MEDKKLTEKESLELITQMIDNTRDKVKKNAGMPFIIWGYSTILVALVVWYVVTTTGNYWFQLLWFMIPVFGYPLNFLLYKKERKQITTFIDRMIGKVWLVFGIGVVMCSVMAFIVNNIPILFLVLLLMSMAVMLSGFVIRFNPAIGFGLFGILASFVFLFIKGTDQIIIFAALFFIMMVIPGHILNYLTKKEASCSKN